MSSTEQIIDQMFEKKIIKDMTVWIRNLMFRLFQTAIVIHIYSLLFRYERSVCIPDDFDKLYTMMSFSSFISYVLYIYIHIYIYIYIIYIYIYIYICYIYIIFRLFIQNS